MSKKPICSDPADDQTNLTQESALNQKHRIFQHKLDQDVVNQINSPIWSTYFVFTGISTLFVWNSVLSLTSYWDSNIQHGIQNIMGFPFMLGGFSSYFIFEAVNKRMTLVQQANIWSCIMVLIFFIYFILGETDCPEAAKATVFLVGCFTQGALNNLSQMAQVRVAMGITFDEIRLYNGGSGIAGMGCSLVNFLLTFFAIPLWTQYMIYLIIVVWQLATIIIIFLQFNKKFIPKQSDCANMDPAQIKRKILKENYLKSENAPQDDLIDFYDQQESKEDIPDTQEKKNYDKLNLIVDKQVKAVSGLLANDVTSWSTKYNVWSKCHPSTTLMWWCFVVTLGTFPVLCFQVGKFFDNDHNFAFVTLIYNIGDFVGKFFADKIPGYQTQAKGGTKFYIYGASRGAFFAVQQGLSVMWVEVPFWGTPILYKIS